MVADLGGVEPFELQSDIFRTILRAQNARRKVSGKELIAIQKTNDVNFLKSRKS